MSILTLPRPSSNAPMPSGPRRKRFTVDEFHQLWENGWFEGVKPMLLDGEIIEMAPSSAEHQRLGGFLHAFLRLFIEHHGLGEIFYAPFQMRLPLRPSGREPDLLFVDASHADRIKDTYLDGPADLVVEIVSPESQMRDRR